MMHMRRAKLTSFGRRSFCSKQISVEPFWNLESIIRMMVFGFWEFALIYIMALMFTDLFDINQKAFS